MKIPLTIPGCIQVIKEYKKQNEIREGYNDDPTTDRQKKLLKLI